MKCSNLQRADIHHLSSGTCLNQRFPKDVSQQLGSVLPSVVRIGYVDTHYISWPCCQCLHWFHANTLYRVLAVDIFRCLDVQCVFIITSSCMFFGMMTRSPFRRTPLSTTISSPKFQNGTMSSGPFVTVLVNTWSVSSHFVMSLIFSNLDLETPVISWIVTLMSGISPPWIGRRDSPSAMGVSFPGKYFTGKSYFCIPSSILISLGGAFIRCFLVIDSRGLWSVSIVTWHPYALWWNRSRPNTIPSISRSMLQ